MKLNLQTHRLIKITKTFIQKITHTIPITAVTNKIITKRNKKNLRKIETMSRSR